MPLIEIDYRITNHDRETREVILCGDRDLGSREAGRSPRGRHWGVTAAAAWADPKVVPAAMSDVSWGPIVSQLMWRRGWTRTLFKHKIDSAVRLWIYIVDQLMQLQTDSKTVFMGMELMSDLMWLVIQSILTILKIALKSILWTEVPLYCWLK